MERLKKKLAQMDVEVREAVRNVKRARDNIDLLNDALTELRGQRDRVGRELTRRSGRRESRWKT